MITNTNIRVAILEPGDDITKIKETAKKIVGNVSHLALWDEGAGNCEILAADDEKVTIQWISYCSCYSCAVYSEAIYTQTEQVEYSRIAEVGPLKWYTKEDVAFERKRYLEMDKGIFERFHKLEKEN